MAHLKLAADKSNGTADEFKAAVLGSSTYFGTLTVDRRDGILTFAVESSSFPNREGTVQRRDSFKPNHLVARLNSGVRPLCNDSGWLQF